MSWRDLDWCASLGEEVKPPLRSLLWAMAYHANRDSGLVKAATRTLAREAGIGKSTVARLLVVAEAAGYVELVEPGSGTRPGTYRLASRQGGTQAGAEGPASVPSAARSVPARVGRNPNPRTPWQTEQQRLAALTARLVDPGAGRRPPDPRGSEPCPPGIGRQQTRAGRPSWPPPPGEPHRPDGARDA